MLPDPCKPSLPLIAKKQPLQDLSRPPIFFITATFTATEEDGCVLNETTVTSTGSVDGSLQAVTATPSKKHGHFGTFHGYHIFFITETFTVTRGR